SGHYAVNIRPIVGATPRFQTPIPSASEPANHEFRHQFHPDSHVRQASQPSTLVQRNQRAGVFRTPWVIPYGIEAVIQPNIGIC
ncbi:MAG: hypothetical protein VCA37_04185, partial [Roseibacillus sp.]